MSVNTDIALSLLITGKKFPPKQLIGAWYEANSYSAVSHYQLIIIIYTTNWKKDYAVYKLGIQLSAHVFQCCYLEPTERKIY